MSLYRIRKGFVVHLDEQTVLPAGAEFNFNDEQYKAHAHKLEVVKVPKGKDATLTANTQTGGAAADTNTQPGGAA